MARWEQYRASRTSWGINVLGSFCVEIEASDGTKGFATGFGGPPACWLVHQHFERFLVGAGKKKTKTPDRHCDQDGNGLSVYRPPRLKRPLREDVPRIHVLRS